MKPPLAVFEFSKNSTEQDITNAKRKLEEIVKKTYPVNVSSNEYGICTIRRIISEVSDSRILFPGDKVNIILISDENNGGLQQNDSHCSAGGTVTRGDAVIQDQFCVYDYTGSSEGRTRIKAKNCDDGYDINRLLNSTQNMTIAPLLGVIKTSVIFKYRQIDSEIEDGLPAEVNFNFENVMATEVDCSPSELNSVRTIVANRTGSPSNLLSCKRRVSNDGFTFSAGNFLVSKSHASNLNETNLISQTFSAKHCREDLPFFDSVSKRLHQSYKHAIVEKMRERGIIGVDPLKVDIAACSQRLSIDHLGQGSANPLAYTDEIVGSHSPEFYDDLGTALVRLLGSQNFVVSSFHHSTVLDAGLCTIDPLEASLGVNQDRLIQNLSTNGFSQSICSGDYSQSLVQFASRFLKDQHRTFILADFRQGTEITSIKINNREIFGLPDSFQLNGNRLTIAEGLLNQGDLIKIEFRYPQ